MEENNLVEEKGIHKGESYIEKENELPESSKELYSEGDDLDYIILGSVEGREIGIDLGTTNSVVAYYEDGTVKTLKFGSESVIPSAIYFEEPGKILFGKQAANRRVINPESGVRYFKRYLAALNDRDRYISVKYQKGTDDTSTIETKHNTYVIDTNIFIEYPDLLKQFTKDDTVYVPITVSEELNYHCEHNPSTKFQAEKARDNFDRYSDRIKYEESDTSLLPADLYKSAKSNNDKNDNKILSIALKVAAEKPILITNDKGLRQKASSVGVLTQKYDEFRLERTMIEGVSQLSFKVTAEEATQLFLRYLREEAMKKLGAVTKAAIGIPASFTPQQEDATREAAFAAGFDEVRLIKEPFAAAIAYGYDMNVEKKILVFDWGGGTFDVSIIDIEAGGKYRNLNNDGMLELGGEDLTKTVVNQMIDMIEDEHGIYIEDYAGLGLSDEEHEKNKMAMYKASEELKIQLSVVETATFIVSLFTESGVRKPFEVQVTRKQFETWITKYVQLALQKTSSTLARSGLQYGDIDITVLAGGTSLIPYVQQQVEAAFGFKPNYEKNAALVIAEGAAIFAASEFGGKIDVTDKPEVFDKTMHHFGVLKNKIDFQNIIPSGSELPCRESHTLMPLHDYSETLEINVYRADVDSRCKFTTDENMMHIEKLTISNIPPRIRTEVDVVITFEMTMQYGLNVSAEIKDRKTGELLSTAHVMKHSAK